MMTGQFKVCDFQVATVNGRARVLFSLYRAEFPGAWIYVGRYSARKRASYAECLSVALARAYGGA